MVSSVCVCVCVCVCVYAGCALNSPIRSNVSDDMWHQHRTLSCWPQILDIQKPTDKNTNTSETSFKGSLSYPSRYIIMMRHSSLRTVLFFPILPLIWEAEDVLVVLYCSLLTHSSLTQTLPRRYRIEWTKRTTKRPPIETPHTGADEFQLIGDRRWLSRTWVRANPDQ